MPKNLFFVFLGVIIILGIGILFFFPKTSKKELPMPKTLENELPRPQRGEVSLRASSFAAPSPTTERRGIPPQNKKIAMVVAFKDFRDEEYFVPKEILESAGAEIKTVSNQMGTSRGADGGEAAVDILLSEAQPLEFDAVIFIGGPGCLKNLDNEDSYRLAKETISQNKVLAAICISPVILAKAGVLERKRATVWSSPLDKSSIDTLQEKGAIYEPKKVVVDGKIITADGPSAAEEFSEAIISVISQ